jgi:hypothetical protein
MDAHCKKTNKAGKVRNMTRKKETNAEVETNAEKVFYLGPSMIEKDGEINFQINYGTIYSNGVPPEIAKRRKADADFARMFIPIGKVSGAMAEISNYGSPLYETRERVKTGYLNRRTRRR